MTCSIAWIKGCDTLHLTPLSVVANLATSCKSSKLSNPEAQIFMWQRCQCITSGIHDKDRRFFSQGTLRSQSSHGLSSRKYLDQEIHELSIASVIWPYQSSTKGGNPWMATRPWVTFASMAIALRRFSQLCQTWDPFQPQLLPWTARPCQPVLSGSWLRDRLCPHSPVLGLPLQLYDLKAHQLSSVSLLEYLSCE